MRWDAIGTTSGPTRIGGTVIPEGSQLLIPIAEPGDIEDCLSCQFGRDHDVFYPMEPAEQFRLHLERHLVPQVRYRPAPTPRPGIVQEVRFGNDIPVRIDRIG